MMSGFSGAEAEARRQIPIVPKASVPITTSPRRRSSPLCRAGAISLSFRKIRRRLWTRSHKQGAILWRYRFGRGSGIGGVWGAAVDEQQAYFSAADYLTPDPVESTAFGSITASASGTRRRARHCAEAARDAARHNRQHSL